jgi:hypothetical protein
LWEFCLILTRPFAQLFKARYNGKHLGGCLLCVVGLVLLVTSDLLSHRFDDSAGNPGAPPSSLQQAL